MGSEHQMLSNPTLWASLALATALSFGPSTTKAEEVFDQQLAQPNDTDFASKGPWNVTLGAGVGYGPRFEGANRDHFVPIPFGSIAYAGVGALGPDGAKLNIFQSSGFRAGLLGGYSGGRNQNEDPRLTGLGNISPTLRLGGFVSYAWQNFELRTQLRQAVIHVSEGMEGSVGVNYTINPTDSWVVKFGPQLIFADSDYMKKFFGISVPQARQSGLTSYSAGAGAKDAAIGLTSTYKISEHWLIFGIAKFSELIGDAA
ncbi:MAG TPA: MipA/OmpV family protein, partial [Rhodospirillaceae bacterium]|nr:MipA/OmpV family protein [Rhodospirillaceae bacterium]